MSETTTLDLLDFVLAHTVESVWTAEPMPRAYVAAWRYDEEREEARAGGEQSSALDLLREVLEATRDSVTFGKPMDGEAVDRWRADALDLRGYVAA